MPREDFIVKTPYLRTKRDVAENLYAAHNRALIALARRDPRIVSCYGDYPQGEAGGVFAKECPDRVLDVGIAEGHLMTSAAGLNLNRAKSRFGSSRMTQPSGRPPSVRPSVQHAGG